MPQVTLTSPVPDPNAELNLIECARQSTTRAMTHAVALATLMPRPLQPLVPSAEGIAALLMNIFFATVGAAGGCLTTLDPSQRVLCIGSVVRLTTTRAFYLSLQCS